LRFTVAQGGLSLRIMDGRGVMAGEGFYSSACMRNAMNCAGGLSTASIV